MVVVSTPFVFRFRAAIMLKISNFQRELLKRAMADAVGGGRVEGGGGGLLEGECG